MSMSGFGGVLSARRTASSRRSATSRLENSTLLEVRLLMSKPQRLCIFCDGKPVTKEHIWSEWTRDLIGRPSARSHLNIVSKNLDRSIIAARRTNGGLDTAKIKVVCGSCNNGWMSRLDTGVKNEASALITGDSAHIERNQQQLLARWLIMKMMVTEHSKGMSVVSSKEDRSAIMGGGWPANHLWSLWLGTQGANSRTRSYVRHYLPLQQSFQAAANDLGIKASTPEHFKKDGQIFVFRIGRMIVVATCFDRVVKFNLKQPSVPCFLRLFPSDSDMMSWPLDRQLSEAEIALLESSAAPFLRK